MKKPRHIWWREEYRANRYLEFKSVEHIAARMRYQAETMLSLTDSGQIGPGDQGSKGMWLMSRFTHTLHEFELRGIGLPEGFMKGANVPRVTYPDIPPEHVCYANRKRKAAGELFRFGNRKWLEETLVKGSLRFAGASFYKDPSLNSAIQDDELSFTIFPTKFGAAPTAGIRGIPSIINDGSIKLTHFSDYYVQCYSTQYELRMFADFSANSCLIIYDAKEFGLRVIRGLQSKFPDWIAGALPVIYVDPDDPGQNPAVIPQIKHMKYAYQNEERIICHPRKPVRGPLPPIYLNVGSLSDIAEVISL